MKLVQKVFTSPHQTLPIINILHTNRSICYNESCMLWLPKVHTSFTFPSLFLRPFSVPGFHSGNRLQPFVVFLWPLLGCDSFSDLAYFQTLVFLRSTNCLCCRMSFNWHLSHIFVCVINLSLCTLGKKTTTIKCHFHQIKDVYSQYDIIIDNNLYNVAEEIWTGFLQQVNFSFIPLCIVYSLEGCLYAQAIITVYRVMLQLHEECDRYSEASQRQPCPKSRISFYMVKGI